jgi:septum formation protein
MQYIDQAFHGFRHLCFRVFLTMGQQFDIPPLILASASPRRHRIFRDAGFQFEIALTDTDESFPPDLKGSDIATYLAEKKSDTYADPLENKLLVTADTIVWFRDEVMNKPLDEAEAVSMLIRLSGQTHTVFTGVCIRSQFRKTVFAESTEVTFHNLEPAFILDYVKRYKPYDKAGSYGIQDRFGLLGVRAVNGCFFNVMGFPAARFYLEVKRFMG